MTKIVYGALCCLIVSLVPASPAPASTRLRPAPARQDAVAGGTPIQIVSVASGLTNPLFITNAKDGTNRLFILEKNGRVRVLQPGASSFTTFLDISTIVSITGERGLLGLAFHPDYSVNGRFFVNYTRSSDGAIVIAEYHVSASNPNVADPNGTILLTIPHPGQSNHNGGMVEFGPDGFLYIATGDGGSSNDPPNNAQNINVLLGKILRIDVDTPNGPVLYSSPSTNPFFGATAGLDEIYAYGLRNPWRFSFDESTGDLIAADVGQGATEEIDEITLGGNYGWRNYEGNTCTNGPCGITFVPPIFVYGHTGGRCSVTGGYVYRGARSTFNQGAYIFGDFCTGEIFALEGGTSTTLLDTPVNISSFGQDEAGEIYVTGHNNGTVYRITSTPAPPACTIGIAPAGASFPETGGSGSVTVTAGADCRWRAASMASWITITSATVGTGDGQVDFTVASNAGSSARTGVIHVGGQTYTVMQAGVPTCADAFQFSAATYSIAEGGASATITVTRTGSCSTPISVGYATSDNTATAGSDYTATVGSLTFDPGVSSRTFVVPITNDTSEEGNESLNLSLTPSGGAVLGQNRRAVLTITDNDNRPQVRFSAPTVTVAETAATATITVERLGATAGTVTVDWSASSNTATVGVDCTATGGTLTFGPGVTSRTFSVSVVNDTAAEGNESIRLSLSNPSGAALAMRSETWLIITDNDVPATGIQFSQASYNVNESGSASIAITRSSTATAQTVTFSTSDNGTAVAGADYTATTVTVTFQVGQASRTVAVPIAADTVVENAESINLTLTDSSGGSTLGVRRTALITIPDNDGNGVLQFQAAVFTVSEAGPTATITVTRTDGTTGAIAVTYSVGANTAGASDFGPTSGTLSFAQGQASRTFTVPITNDALAEGVESLNLTLSNPTGGAVLGAARRAILVITDND
jgi:glucose/arabinose dehydrogenase